MESQALLFRLNEYSLCVCVRVCVCVSSVSVSS